MEVGAAIGKILSGLISMQALTLVLQRPSLLPLKKVVLISFCQTLLVNPLRKLSYPILTHAYYRVIVAYTDEERLIGDSAVNQ